MEHGVLVTPNRAKSGNAIFICAASSPRAFVARREVHISGPAFRPKRWSRTALMMEKPALGSGSSEWQEVIMSATFTVGVLTPSKHRSAVWITALVEKLQARAPNATIEILDVESAPLDVGNGGSGPGMRWELLVNRVSDAAPPATVKAALMFLRAAELQGSRVINGITAYSTGVNKALHHVALHRVGLYTPATVVCRSLPPPETELSRLTFPVLLKPNSGA